MAKEKGTHRSWRMKERLFGGAPAEPIATFDYDTDKADPGMDRAVIEAEQKAQELALATGIEHAVVLAEDGKGYLTRGDEGSVGLAGGAFSGIQNAYMITHTHPPGNAGRSDSFRGKGGSFSRQDIAIAQTRNPRVIKAVGPEGTYIMSRPKRGWGNMSKNAMDRSIEHYRQRLIKTKPKKYGGAKNEGLAFIDAVHLHWAAYARVTGAHYRFKPNPKWTGPTY